MSDGSPHSAQQRRLGKYLMVGNRESPSPSLLPVCSGISSEVTVLLLNERCTSFALSQRRQIVHGFAKGRGNTVFNAFNAINPFCKEKAVQ